MDMSGEVEICDTLVMEQLLGSMPAELQVWIRERKPKSTREAGELTDDYVLARKAANPAGGRDVTSVSRWGTWLETAQRMHSCQSSVHRIPSGYLPKHDLNHGATSVDDWDTSHQSALLWARLNRDSFAMSEEAEQGRRAYNS